MMLLRLAIVSILAAGDVSAQVVYRLYTDSGISKMTLPNTLMVGNGGTQAGSPVGDLINLLTIEKAKDVSKQ